MENTLTADGLVEKYSYNTVPPRVEYSLSPLSHTLLPIAWVTD
ncbi:MAG: winged helix-turn-helix transcriptional regulator [Muribaculaceae bacterium]|nr:winged helix-turn-helix transcriptional regulator [Muribaculaceae bacterium]